MEIHDTIVFTYICFKNVFHDPLRMNNCQLSKVLPSCLYPVSILMAHLTLALYVSSVLSLFHHLFSHW